ncbi:MAG TPA: hypothetical protein VE078_04720 [Thermoanaerobaculia bacterium]|nr:hypothetical protein [Thermoanaerobaculia bacterium]
MPEISSFADFMADWDRLIKGVQNNQSILPDLEGLVGPLEGFLNEAKDLDSGKAAARSQLSQGAKRSRSLIPEGRAAASRLRSALKAHFGGHNEKLVEFGIAPLRARRLAPPADPPPPSPAIPVPEPE